MNNTIHHNVIIHPGDVAQDGIFVYRATDLSNKFDNNTYYVEDASIKHWHSGRTNYRWQGFVENAGMEQHGKRLVQGEISAAGRLSPG